MVDNLEKAQRIQNVFKAYEIIDRNLMEHNFERVNFWSMVNISLMITVGVIQVSTSIILILFIILLLFLLFMIDRF